MNKYIVLGFLIYSLVGCRTAKWEPLFPGDGKPEEWFTGHWADVADPAPEGTDWQVKNGILTNEGVRGGWILSKKEYCNFELEFEFLLGEKGNSGCALRVPAKGDPAFDGIELQMADLRYNRDAADSELTGGIYRALAPLQQVYKPLEWNKYRIFCNGSHIKVKLNDILIQDFNMKDYDMTVMRHNGKEAVPLNKRPLCGHIGFQELSRDSKAQVRNIRIKEFR
ncbi:MAG: DUF1080 domain-containing protein [Bacteroidales bacterium]|jgi:hypothetical protein|nr:DUF1080 domain-containing protein [Bacteroidales bacterium]